MGTKNSYWGLKNEEFISLCEERGIDWGTDPKKLNRQKLNNELKAWDARNGLNEDIVMVDHDEQGDKVYEGSEAIKNEINTNSKENDEDTEDMIIVRFHHQDDQTKTVFIGLNGKSYYIPREKNILMPKALLRVIQDAVILKIEQFTGPDGRLYNREKRVPRFSYDVII